MAEAITRAAEGEDSADSAEEAPAAVGRGEVFRNREQGFDVYRLMVRRRDEGL